MRRENARNAMILYANMGQREKMLATYRILLKMNPSAEEKATADYTVASFDYKQWRPTEPDTGSNRQTRFAAEAALTQYFQRERNSPGTAKYIVESAYGIAKMKKAGGDGRYRAWMKSTISAWDNYAAKAPVKDGVSEAQNAPYVDYAAESAYTLLDEEITQKFDDPAKHKYPPSAGEIFGEVELDPKTKKVILGPDGKPKLKKKGRYQPNAAEAEKWDLELDKIVKKYKSLEWLPTAVARQGQVFDTLRMGLYNMVKVETMTPEEKRLVKQMRDSGRPELDQLADTLEDAKTDFWRKKKAQELDGADTVMIKRYAQAVAYARRFNVRNAQLTRAVSRLAFFTDVINGGDAKMGEIVRSTPDPDPDKKGQNLSYSPRQYVQSRPGLGALPPPEGKASPLPAAP